MQPLRTTAPRPGKINGMYLAWVGTNDTQGEPNSRTGNYSFRGRFYQFKTLMLRDMFVAGYEDTEGGTRAKAINSPLRAREMDMGSTMREHDQTLLGAIIMTEADFI